MLLFSWCGVQPFGTPWTVARQAPLSMGFPRKEYWSGLLVPSPRAYQPRDWTCVSALQVDSLAQSQQGSPFSYVHACRYVCKGTYVCCVCLSMPRYTQADTSLDRSSSKPKVEFLVFSLLYKQESWSSKSLSNSSEATELVGNGSRILISDLAPGFPAQEYLLYKLRVKSRLIVTDYFIVHS